MAVVSRIQYGFLMQMHKRLIPNWTISEDVLTRTGLLFIALCLVKVVMLIGFRKHLFEAYWRVSSPAFGWLNFAAYFLFTILVGLTLWNLGKRYETAGVGVLRNINFSVLGLGIAFIALTFHEGDKSHLQALMSGVLSLKDLGPYYALNFFFRSPYLSLWVVVYALTYYFLKRKGLERFVLQATALFAVAYILLCMRMLIAYREEVIVADALGIACLLCSRRDSAPLNLTWIVLPVLWIAALYLAFTDYSGLLSSPRSEFVVLVLGSLIVFTGITLLARRRGFYAGWSWAVVFLCISFLLLVNANYPTSDNYRNMLCVMLTVPRYFLGEFGLVLLLLMVSGCYRRRRPAGSLLWLDILNIALIAVALLDLRLSQIMGTRLDWDILSLAMGETPKMMWRLAKPYLPLVVILLVATGLIYAVACLYVRRFVQRPGVPSAVQKFNLHYALAVCILLGVAGRLVLGSDKALGQTVWVLAQTSPLWRGTSSPLLDEKTFADNARRLGMETVLTAPSLSPGTRTARDLNVIFILLESTYNKHLSLFNGTEDTQPLLSQYKDRMQLFPNFYSSFAGSINARFACYTGLYPVSDYKMFTTHWVGVRSVFELLHDQGYATSMFYSSHFDYTGFRDFLRRRNVDEMYDADTMPGAEESRHVSWGVSEEATLEAMRAQIRKYAEGKKKFFMCYVPAAPHYPFDGTPERFHKYNLHKVKDFTPLYLNELLYMDWIQASIVDQLKESGLLDSTLVVITGDHGEMLGADGDPIGHGWALTPALANVPLIIMDPGKPGYHVNDTVGSQVDILPTILDILGIPLPTDQLYQGVSLYSTNAQADRTIFLNTYSQYAVAEGRHLIFGDRKAEADGKSDKPHKSFLVQNNGARTSFEEMETPLPMPFAVSDFDKFQENFLRNYSEYCRMLRPVDSASPPATK